MSIFFKILVRIASYGPQIDQSQGHNRLSHIIISVIPPCPITVLTVRLSTFLRTYFML